MIHTTELKHNHAVYTDVYLFLKLYLNGAGTAESEAILYADQTIKEQIGAMRLSNYTFDELGSNPLDTLHTLTLAKLQEDNPNSILTIVNPIINVINESENEPGN